MSLTASGCGSDEIADDLTFDEAVDAGWNCNALYELRNSYGPHWTGRDAANETLFRIGCVAGEVRRATTTIPGDPTRVCLEAMEEMDEVYNSATDADFAAMSERSLVVCETAGAWLEAARQHPGAVGLSAGGYVQPLDLQNNCFNAPTTVVCEDAYKQALFVRPER